MSSGNQEGSEYVVHTPAAAGAAIPANASQGSKSKLLSVEQRMPPDSRFEEKPNGQPLSLRRATFATLAMGRPLEDRLSTAYLRRVGIYVYEDASGEAVAAIATPLQLPVIKTIEWTLQRHLV